MIERVRLGNAKFGQPEVNLGVIPGFGGTQRLPRLIGVDEAVTWMATGADQRADAALKAGAVGYLDFSGNLDTAIGLRTMVADGNRAWIQAGAGIVADSDPGAEYVECVNKAAAVLTAIAAARILV